MSSVSPPSALPIPRRVHQGWHGAAFAALALAALFHGWEWCAPDRMPRDDFPGYVAQIQYVRDALLEHGRVPVWCAECYGGTTNFTGNLKEWIAFPLALLFDPILAAKLAFLLWKIAGGCALYALVVRYLAAPGAGIVAGYSFAFGEIANHQIEHLDGVVALALTPLLVIAGVELLRRGGIGPVLALGVLAASQFVNNGVHALWVPPILLALAILRPGLPETANPWRDRCLAASWLRRIAAAVAVCLLFAASQLAWIALDSDHHRLFPAQQIAADRAWAVERSPFLFANRANALAPWLATHHPPGFDLVSLDGGRRYVGAVWFAVCAIGAFAMRGARHADLRRWAAFAGLLLWLSYWLALGPRTLLWEIATSLHWTPAAQTAIATILAIASGSCALIALGLAVRAWRSRATASWAGIRRAILAAALLAFPVTSLWSLCARVLPMLEQQRSPGRFFDLASAWLYLLLAVALVAIARRVARPRVAAAVTAGIAVLVVIDFAPSRQRFSRIIPIEPLRRAAALLGAVPAEGGSLRVGQVMRYLPLASWLVAQSPLGHASGWLPWQGSRYWEVLMKGALDPRGWSPRTGVPMAPDATILSAARVRYLLLLQRAQQPLREPWRRVGEEGGFVLWELPEVSPVASGFRSYAIVADDVPPAAVSRALQANVLAVSVPASAATLHPAAPTPLGSDPDATFPTALAPITATTRRLSPEQIAIEIDAGAEPAILSVSEAHHPWWRARVDGEPAPVWRANLALMAVPVGPGPHRVELWFERPALLALADGVTAAAWIALGVAIPIALCVRTFARRLPR